ncbi:chemotaxis protein [Tupanvirus soda lake]|uniref:Chemotaxis protein n=2 Tax=Tupanvirus TaxID=2094720 RepID=A0A6N1NNV1_9VIRU|nr:chemotaxis protein [Tupanvirus soda lake]QKU35935.1 chemotaxis protein [Tupanvirus soda lake]
MLKSSKKIKKLIFNEKYHDNCHDYLKPIYLEKYAVPKYKPLLYDIREKIPKINICEDTPYELYGEVIVCDQHAVIFSHHKDIYPIVATYALNACVALVMYSEKYKIAALAHIDGLPGYSKQSAILDGLNIEFDPVYENIKIILKNIRSFCGTNDVIDIDYYLIGGIFDLSEVMVHDIIECLDKFMKNYKFKFKGRNILGPENQSRNICLNTKTGKITYFDYTVNSEYYANHRDKQGLPINIIKAPRKSEAFLDITYISKMPNTME